MLKLTVTGQKAEALVLKEQILLTGQAVKIRDTLIRSKYDAYIQQANLKALLGTLDTAIN